MLIKCQSKIAEFCSARDAEKEDLLQDLSVNMPHHPSSPPAHMMTQSHYSQPLQIPAFYQQPQQQPGLSVCIVFVLLILCFLPLETAMLARSSDRNFDCPSVNPSHACFVTKRKNILPIF